MKDYNYSKNNHCICEKPISDNATFCNSCERRNRYVDKKNTPNWKDGKYSTVNYCITCHKKISAEAVCCRSCAMKELFNNPKNHPGYKNGKSLEKSSCIVCGKELSRGDAQRCLKCHNKYVSELIIDTGIMKGKNHWNWHGGITREGYPYRFNGILKEFIRIRDNYICQLCFKPGKYVHHIDYNKKHCSKDNLINLCCSCNVKVNYNRDKWMKYFKKIIKILIRRN